MTMLLVMDALPIGNNGQMIMKKQLGSCGGNMGKNIGEKRKHTIKNTTGRKGRKYSVKRVKGKVKTCNWLRHLRTRKHRYGMIWNWTWRWWAICFSKLPRSTTYEIWVLWMKRDTDAFPASLCPTTSWVPRTASAHHASMLSAVWIHVINSWSLGEWKEIANMSDA